MTLPVAQTTGWDWEGCRREQSWPNLRHYSGIRLERLKKIRKISATTAAVSAEIRTRHVWNTRQKRYRLSKCARCHHKEGQDHTN
jgi:cytochrome c553